VRELAASGELTDAQRFALRVVAKAAASLLEK